MKSQLLHLFAGINVHPLFPRALSVFLVLTVLIPSLVFAWDTTCNYDRKESGLSCTTAECGCGVHAPANCGAAGQTSWIRGDNGNGRDQCRDPGNKYRGGKENDPAQDCGLMWAQDDPCVLLGTVCACPLRDPTNDLPVFVGGQQIRTPKSVCAAC